MAAPAPPRKTTLVPTNKGRFGMKATRPTIAIDEVTNEESEQTGGGKSAAEMMFSGAEPREESIDSFKTDDDEAEIDNEKQNDATAKPEAGNVTGKKSAEKKKEPAPVKGLAKKGTTHHEVRSTISTGIGAAKGLAKPSGLRGSVAATDASKRADKAAEVKPKVSETRKSGTGLRLGAGVQR